MDTPKRAGELFEAGWYCAESVLLAVADQRGLKSELVPGIATGLCGGVARTSGMCGALGGAVLALGLELGRVSPDDSVEPCYAAVQQLLARFEAVHGATGCTALTGCDLGTDAGQARFRETGARHQCTGFTETATRLALELLEDPPRVLISRT
jgi:C_GCAxxG_C_C family probable redox protein